MVKTIKDLCQLIGTNSKTIEGINKGINEGIILRIRNR
jgi:hypothetical protein